MGSWCEASHQNPSFLRPNPAWCNVVNDNCLKLRDKDNPCVWLHGKSFLALINVGVGCLLSQFCFSA